MNLIFTEPHTQQKAGGTNIKDLIPLPIRKFIHDLGVYLFTEPNYYYLKRLFSRFVRDFGFSHLAVCCMIFIGAYVVGALRERNVRGQTKAGTEAQTSNRSKTLLSVRPFCFAVMLAYYYILILYTVVFRPIYNTYQYHLELFWSYKRALNGAAYLYYEIVLNYFLLFPVGILIRLLLPKKCPHAFLVAFSIICFSSVAIEIMQLLLRRGLFEFDDILGNVLGGIVGYAICAGMENLAVRMRRKIK